MKLPDHLRRALAERSPEPERQSIMLAFLLQPPAALRGRRQHHWQPPPLSKGSPAGGHAASVRGTRQH